MRSRALNLIEGARAHLPKWVAADVFLSRMFSFELWCVIVRIASKKNNAAFAGRVFIWGRFLGTGKGWVAIANIL